MSNQSYSLLYIYSYMYQHRPKRNFSDAGLVARWGAAKILLKSLFLACLPEDMQDRDHVQAQAKPLQYPIGLIRYILLSEAAT